jgi:hypothetical protein
MNSTHYPLGRFDTTKGTLNHTENNYIFDERIYGI